MRVTLTIALSGLLATSPAYATTLDINVEVPKLNVAEYHRPYVAVWLEGADQKVAANLSVWYQQTSNSEGHGTKWLPDLRQWWRKSGRELKVPVDGVTGPTTTPSWSKPCAKSAAANCSKSPSPGRSPPSRTARRRAPPNSAWSPSAPNRDLPPAFAGGHTASPHRRVASAVGPFPLHRACPSHLPPTWSC